MAILKIHVFKQSFGPIITLLNENEVKYQVDETRSGEIVAASTALEIIANASIWVSLATVVVSFIKAKNSREVIITTKDNEIIHAKGLDSKQLQKVLEHAKEINAIDTANE
jgi:hypothetical protein